MQPRTDHHRANGRRARLPSLLLMVLLAGCASAPRADDGATTWLRLDAGTALTPADDAQDVHDALEGRPPAGRTGAIPTRWWLPAGPPSALLLLQHGFARRCANLRTTAAEAAGRGLLVLCIDAGMGRGRAALADRLVAALLAGNIAPAGVVLPDGIIVGGHSAGAVFAARVGAQLAAAAPARLRGALLLDPVTAAGFAADLQAISGGGHRPVLAITAKPSRCNARNSADAALLALPGGLVGLQLTDRSTHVDAEGPDTTRLAIAACGRPLPKNVQLVRALAVQWAADVAATARADVAEHPAGALAEHTVGSGAARRIVPAAGTGPDRR